MNNLNLNFNKPIGKVKPMHAINNAPIIGANPNMFHFLGEAKIPFSRLHDTGGAFGNNPFVDIPNIFPNFDADVDSPDSYDFAFTDWLLLQLEKQGVEPYYRLGVSIENYPHIKAYRIFPPKDYTKWAKICEHVIAHYNEGWADGFHMSIRYWEIWNEPDINPDPKKSMMWQASFEEYIELYKVTAKHLKSRFGDTIKVGGFASCGFYAILDQYNEESKSTPQTEYHIECFHKFMKAISADRAPLDFFSWHSYSGVKENLIYNEYARKQLDLYGYKGTENIFNEWNMGIKQRGTLKDSSDICANILALSPTRLDMLMYYDGQVNGSYNGLFNPITYEPFKAYYVFKAYSSIYELDEMVEVTNGNDELYCVAAKNDTDIAIILTNRNEDTVIKINSTENCSEYLLYRLNDGSNMDLAESLTSLDELRIGQYETVLICAKRS